jgi:hypothetical protein
MESLSPSGKLFLPGTDHFNFLVRTSSKVHYIVFFVFSIQEAGSILKLGL